MEVPSALDAASAEQVWARLAEHVRPGRTRQIPLDEADGAVLAADVRAERPFPPFDRAVMDGFALRAATVQSPGQALAVSGLVRAGDSQAPLTPDTCMQINTGAPVPNGADAVVMVERTRRGDNGDVFIDEAPQPGQLVERRGALLEPGDLIARAGTRLAPGAIAGIAAAGIAEVTIFARPRVSILTTGNELVSWTEVPAATQIPDSNAVLLERLTTAAGADPVREGRCPDDPGALRASLELGMSEDVLVVAGGMSKGTHDLVPSLLEELGVRWWVTSLDLKPGKPTRIGRAANGCWVFGLPGNPVSCGVCFLLFTAAVLRGLRGLGTKPPPTLKGRLESDLGPNGARPMYHPAEWVASPDGTLSVLPVSWRGSGDPYGLVGANALLYRPGNAPAAPRGEAVVFVPFDLPQ